MKKKEKTKMLKDIFTVYDFVVCAIGKTTSTNSAQPAIRLRDSTIRRTMRRHNFRTLLGEDTTRYVGEG